MEGGIKLDSLNNDVYTHNSQKLDAIQMPASRHKDTKNMHVQQKNIIHSSKGVKLYMLQQWALSLWE